MQSVGTFPHPCNNLLRPTTSGASTAAVAIVVVATTIAAAVLPGAYNLATSPPDLASSPSPRQPQGSLVGHFEFCGGERERLHWEQALHATARSSSWWLPAATVRNHLTEIAGVAPEFSLWSADDRLCMVVPGRRRVHVCAPSDGTATIWRDPDDTPTTVSFGSRGGCLTQEFATKNGTRRNTLCRKEEKFVSSVKVTSRFFSTPFVYDLTYCRG